MEYANSDKPLINPSFLLTFIHMMCETLQWVRLGSSKGLTSPLFCWFKFNVKNSLDPSYLCEIRPIPNGRPFDHLNFS
jgi:hypothetical protein